MNTISWPAIGSKETELLRTLECDQNNAHSNIIYVFLLYMPNPIIICGQSMKASNSVKKR